MTESGGGSNVQDDLAREMRAQLAAVTGGIAPDDYAQAWWDWYLNLAQTPDKQTAIAKTAFEALLDNFTFAMQASTGQPVAPAVDDKRFESEAWNQWPFNIMARGYMNWEHLVKQATSNIPGLSGRSADLVAFSSKQALEAASPANHLLANPELLELTRVQSGQNLVAGFKNWLEDVDATLNHKAPAGSEAFKVGENVAVTPGKVVYRNELIEVIQYEAATPTVHAEPILIVPAWIMKYYILDLSPRNSLVRYLVDKGHTVFMISWKNPNETDRNLGMDDYHNKGIRDALNVVSAIVPNVKIHAVGYCIGGTLLSIAAAELAREGDHRLASMTLLAAQTDFSAPGELSLFISPSQLSMLEAVMHKAGVLSSDKMGASFALLRSRDLLWTPAINTYVKGNREKLNDLMAWNSDGTRMPFRMHSEYLKHLYLQNDLAEGRFRVNGERIDLSAITLPMFVLGTETDHVAPWKSTYKARAWTRSTDYTFVLTNGGHNGGIVSGPVNPKRRYRELTWKNAQASLDPDQWLQQATLHQGSWWPSWQAWLAAHSGPPDAPLPDLGNQSAGYGILGDAPGSYVLER
ncbi:MAG TPA: alpha/beta fold hydrolase [Steroidobacteraceae bacterium]|nr:alpha/beta fold hydrolase [Steroidobacteraceae bacterium]